VAAGPAHEADGPGLHYDQVVLKFDAAMELLRSEVADFIDPDLHQAYSVLFEAAEALEYVMDGMYGPDPGSPWRVLTNYAPERPEQLRKLTTARDLFAAAYRTLINLLNRRDLLPQDQVAAPDAFAGSSTTPPARAQRSDDQAVSGTAAGALATLADEPRPVGRWTAQQLGVHPAIHGATDTVAGQGFVLPDYVERGHDRRLRELFAEAAGSEQSAMVVVRGGSCAGKTRTAFEAVRACLGDWDLAFPKDCDYSL